ncbi:GNAT family N-acetyltransferase [Arthrobacter zhaoguopingii]|uniref:GNAT family N-acetyltransferase n=1 Tax=Arthrobacter zhaoguopingii TaxID=2681491 RepID=UPI001915BCA7
MVACMLSRSRSAKIWSSSSSKGMTPTLPQASKDRTCELVPRRALCRAGLTQQESRRPRGAGTARCAWAEEQAAAAGFGAIYLGVGVDNDRARKLYERLGYRPLGESVTTTYNYVDDAGVTQTATETDGLYVLDLRGRENR